MFLVDADALVVVTCVCCVRACECCVEVCGRVAWAYTCVVNSCAIIIKGGGSEMCEVGVIVGENG